MIGELSYDYWLIPTGAQFINQNSDAIGDFVYKNIWGYFHDLNPDNLRRIGKPMDTSVYLWYLNPTASYATNAAYSIATGNTLNIDVAYNQSNVNVPLAMAASDVSGVAADYNKGFFADPENRLAYDKSTPGGYQHTALFYNIVYNAFCAVPRIAVYKTDGSDTFIAATLDTLATIIDASPSTRFLSYWRYDLYSGTSTNRVISEYYNEGTYRTVAMPDILSDRPIPESCTVVRDVVGDVNASPAHDPAWVDDKVYSPFAAALCRDWSLSDTESTDNQYRVGFTQQYTPSNLRNGRGAYHGGRVTGQFFKYNPSEQNFSDVGYKWEIVIYDYTDKIFLQPGYDITSLSHNLRFMTRLVITDMKDAATIGEATVRAVKHEMAYLGFYFADSVALGQTGVLGSSGNGVGIYLPEKIGGVTTGNYFTGDEIKDVPYADADSVAPFKYVDNDEGDITVNQPSQGNPQSYMNTGTYGSGVKYYQTTLTELKDLMTWCNTGYQPNDQDEFYRDFKGTNPSEYVTTLKFFPFELPKMRIPVPVDMTIGPLTATGAQGIPFPAQNYGNVYSFEPYLMPAFGDFRDGQTIFSVYVPFCGNMLLDPKIWAGTTLSIGLSIDYVTGTCTALLRQNGHIMETMQGTCAIDVPITLLATGDYQNYVHDKLIQASETARNRFWGGLNVAKGLIKAAGGVAVTGATFGAAAPIASGMVTSGASDVLTGWESAAKATRQIENLEYQVDHAQPNVGVVGSASPAIGLGLPIYAQVDTYQVVFNKDYNATAYGKTVGYACLAQGTLSGKINGMKISGFAKCTNIRLDGIAATNTERNMISELMQSGVIV